MSFQILNKKQFDHQRWDALVDKDLESTIFSKSFYVNALVDDWSIVINNDWTGGMILPHKVILGQNILFTPNFMRYVEWIGEKPLRFDAVSKLLKASFQIIELNLKENYFSIDCNRRVHQVLMPNEIKLNQQAKRMLKKDQLALKWDFNFDPQLLIELISIELKEKTNAWHADSGANLYKLIQALKYANQLKTISFWDGDKLKGGLFLMEHQNTLTYLKGSVLSEGKSKGWMYQLIYASILFAGQKNKIFDFGGSGVDGVRRFNCNFGAMDLNYYTFTIDQSPLWYKILKYLKKWLKK